MANQRFSVSYIADRFPRVYETISRVLFPNCDPSTIPNPEILWDDENKVPTRYYYGPTNNKQGNLPLDGAIGVVVWCDETYGGGYSEAVWRNGKRDGFGARYDSNGRKTYEGWYSNEKRQGYGVQYYSDGTTEYKGWWDNNQWDGYGVAWYAGEHGRTRYDGWWKEGKANGHGTLFEPNGNVKKYGWWKHDQWQGPARSQPPPKPTQLTIPTPHFKDWSETGGIEGWYRRNGRLRHQQQQRDQQLREMSASRKSIDYIARNFPRACETLTNQLFPYRDRSTIPDANILWENDSGVPSGYYYGPTNEQGNLPLDGAIGVVVWCDETNGGGYYVGGWRNGKRDGFGVRYESNGRKTYEGWYNNEGRQGYGVQYYSDGTTKYEGWWDNSQWDGYGVEWYAGEHGRTRYDGWWKEGKADGHGTLFEPNGNVQYDGWWKQDFCKGPAYRPPPPEPTRPTIPPQQFKDWSEAGSLEGWCKRRGRLHQQQQQQQPSIGMSQTQSPPSQEPETEQRRKRERDHEEDLQQREHEQQQRFQQRESDLQRRESGLRQREGDLQRREGALRQREGDVQQREQRQDQREGVVQQREHEQQQRFQQREQELVRREQAVQQREQELQQQSPCGRAVFQPSEGDRAKDFECAVCMQTWSNPEMLSPCDHAFCAACIAPIRDQGCPTCRQHIVSSAPVNRLLRNMCDALPGKCSDCNWQGTYEQWRTHRNRLADDSGDQGGTDRGGSRGRGRGRGGGRGRGNGN